LFSNTTGNSSTAYGYESLRDNNTTGNSAYGTYSLASSTSGYDNGAFGYNALGSNTTGYFSNAFGFRCLQASTTAVHNDAFGTNALGGATTGSYNKAFGDHALFNLSTGTANAAFGHFAGYSLTTGGNNVFLGAQSGRQGYSPFTPTTHDYRVVIGQNGITNAYIKVAWTVTSDKRDKADITDFNHGLSYINQLRPVNFVWDDRSNYKDRISDGSKKKDKPQLGFLAQEVLAVESSLGIDNDCIIDKEEPDLYKMTETKLIPVLVNAIKELSAENKALTTSLESLTARLEALENS
jgi:hypothetical protein